MKESTQVVIIGAGPAGLSLALLLKQEGIDSVILEHRSREYIESRVRAGLLEQNTVDLFHDLDVADRLEKEGMIHEGVNFQFDGLKQRIPFVDLLDGRCITIYGQQEVVKDLVKASLERGVEIKFEARAEKVNDIETNSPSVIYEENGEQHEITGDFVAGCDGFHGVSRDALPEESYQKFENVYPMSWLGILAYASPATEELIYSYHERGFALHSMRSDEVSRLYLQVDNDESTDDWSDEQIWDELEVRLAAEDFELNRGEIFQKDIVPLRSFMMDSIQHGRLFLSGDAAHIVPPTGGKGLNLAVADSRWLADGLTSHFKEDYDKKLENYSKNALKRVWRVQDFSDYMTNLFHKQAEHGGFQYHLQKSRFDLIRSSEDFATTIADNYVGIKEI